MRERHATISVCVVGNGITPARAGKTATWTARHEKSQDHPRSCGKDMPAHSLLLKAVGSPPLVRERPGDGVFFPASIRITPARAGKTGVKNRWSYSIQDHPRSCGKDVYANSFSWAHTGSPPLVRERLKIAVYSLKGGGITPARAGKTDEAPAVEAMNRDHPRSCGKDESVREKNPALKGSPPLVRERPSLARPMYVSSRITPARAGKTSLA